MQSIKIDLGERSYDIIIGKDNFGYLGEFLKTSKYSPKAMIVTDENVAKLYLEKVKKIVIDSGFTPETIIVPAGEEAKSLKWAEAIYTKAIEGNFDRKTPFIAIGGGVVGDLTGFVAATYMRGVPFLQIPTTLLAQVDASVGGKVAVNHPLGKNLIGAFYQPDLVLIDSLAINTLSSRDFASGIAEVIKCALLENEARFVFLEENVDKILAKDTLVMNEIIKTCCLYKAKIVAADEKESGERMFLNLGHTYGHAIEGEGGFSYYTHGESVAIGMHGALLLSESVLNLPKDITKRACDLLQKFSLPIFFEKLDLDNVYKALWHDKKAFSGNINWVLLNEIGEPRACADVGKDLIRSTLNTIKTTEK